MFEQKQETICLFDSDTNEWTVFTTLPYHWNLLKSHGISPYWQQMSDGKINAAKFILPADKISLLATASIFGKSESCKSELTLLN